MKKFELTSESILFMGRKLYRIKALINFGSVKVGDLGGYVEKEENLSVYGDAWVYGNAEVSKSTHLLQIGTIGSRDGITTFFRTKAKEIHVCCGCFAGSLS